MRTEAAASIKERAQGTNLMVREINQALFYARKLDKQKLRHDRSTVDISWVSVV